jgi:hypothetical protein
MSFFALLISLVGLRTAAVPGLTSDAASAADAALLLVLCDHALSLHIN